MSSKLFVGGLAWGTDNDSLRAAFEPHGEVREAVVITDRETGRSRGFGFVTMNSPEEAEAARASMDNASVDGRTIRVNLAEERAGGGAGAPRRDGPPRPPRPGGPPRGDRPSGPGGPGGGGFRGPGGPPMGRGGPPPRGPRPGGRDEGGGWGAPPPEENAGWADEDRKNNKRARRWEDRTEKRPGSPDEDRAGGGRGAERGKSRRRSWDDWEDD